MDMPNTHFLFRKGKRPDGGGPRQLNRPVTDSGSWRGASPGPPGPAASEEMGGSGCAFIESGRHHFVASPSRWHLPGRSRQPLTSPPYDWGFDGGLPRPQRRRAADLYVLQRFQHAGSPLAERRPRHFRALPRLALRKAACSPWPWICGHQPGRPRRLHRRSTCSAASTGTAWWSRPTAVRQVRPSASSTTGPVFAQHAHAQPRRRPRSLSRPTAGSRPSIGRGALGVPRRGPSTAGKHSGRQRH